MTLEEIDPAAFYLWLVRDERTGKQRKTTYRMQPATASERYPGRGGDLVVEGDSRGRRRGRASIGNRRSD